MKRKRMSDADRLEMNAKKKAFRIEPDNPITAFLSYMVLEASRGKKGTFFSANPELREYWVDNFSIRNDIERIGFRVTLIGCHWSKDLISTPFAENIYHQSLVGELMIPFIESNIFE